jgi:hypothetical protein
MGGFKCRRCGYYAAQYSHLVKHLQRKKPCLPIYSTDSPSVILLEIQADKSLCQVALNKPNEVSNITTGGGISNASLTDTNNPLQCTHCNKTFVSISNRKRHESKCKKKIESQIEKNPEMNVLMNKLNKLEEINQTLKDVVHSNQAKDQQISELIAQVGNASKTTNVTNNVNIHLNAFGSCSLDHLSEIDYMRCIERATGCIQNLIEMIYFNPNAPQNHNVCIKDIKSRYALLYNGQKWTLHDQDNVIDELVDSSHYTLEQQYINLCGNPIINPPKKIQMKYQTYNQQKEKEEVQDTIKNDVKLLLYNKRDMCNAK